MSTLKWHKDNNIAKHGIYHAYTISGEIDLFIFRDKYDRSDFPYTVQLAGGSLHGFAKELSRWSRLSEAKAEIQKIKDGA